MAEEKSLHRMPVADCGDYAEIPLSREATLLCLWQHHRTFGAITSAMPTPSLAERATNMSESELNNYKQFNTKKQIV